MSFPTSKTSHAVASVLEAETPGFGPFFLSDAIPKRWTTSPIYWSGLCNALPPTAATARSSRAFHPNRSAVAKPAWPQ